MFSFYFLSSAIIFLHEYFRNKYPNQYAQAAILVYYNLIYVYTHLQIFFKQSSVNLEKFELEVLLYMPYTLYLLASNKSAKYDPSCPVTPVIIAVFI